MFRPLPVEREPSTNLARALARDSSNSLKALAGELRCRAARQQQKRERITHVQTANLLHLVKTHFGSQQE